MELNNTNLKEYPTLYILIILRLQRLAIPNPCSPCKYAVVNTKLFNHCWESRNYRNSNLYCVSGVGAEKYVIIFPTSTKLYEFLLSLLVICVALHRAGVVTTREFLDACANIVLVQGIC